MKKISLFITMSLDGYIADRKGSVNWLVGHDRLNLYQKIKDFASSQSLYLLSSKSLVSFLFIPFPALFQIRIEQLLEQSLRRPVPAL